MKRSFAILLALLFILLLQNPAHAHLVTTGLGPVYDGIGHFCLSPDDSIPVIALALLAGLRGKSAGRAILFQLPLAWITGGILALLTHPQPSFPLQCLSFMLIGLLIATDLRLPPTAVMLLAIIIGGLHGFLDGAAISGAGPSNGLLQLIGIGTVIFVFATLLSAFIVSLRPLWTGIVVRVAGSWIAAIGLLMLGWALRPIH